MNDQQTRNEFRNKLTNRFFFYQWNHEEGSEQTASVSIKPGWYELLWNVSLKIEQGFASDSIKHRFIIYEVFQKYGGMNFRNTYYNDFIERILLEAEDRSNEICEVCGQCGETRDERLGILTLCNECNSKRNDRFG